MAGRRRNDTAPTRYGRDNARAQSARLTEADAQHPATSRRQLTLALRSKRKDRECPPPDVFIFATATRGCIWVARLPRGGRRSLAAVVDAPRLRDRWIGKAAVDTDVV